MLLKGKRPTLFGDGSKARDYDHIDDVIRAHILAIKKGDNEIINIGWGKPVTDKQVIDTVQKALGTKIKPIIGKPKPGEVYRFYLDCRKAKRILGWEPKIKFEDGIKRTVGYYKDFVKTKRVKR